MHRLVDSSWYLVDGVVKGWVKNVNKLRTVSGKRCGVSSTKDTLKTTSAFNSGVKVDVIRMFHHFLLTALSTQKMYSFYLSEWTYTHYPQPLLLERLKKI